MGDVNAQTAQVQLRHWANSSPVACFGVGRGRKFTRGSLYVAQIRLSALAVLQRVLGVVKGPSTEALDQTQDVATCYTATPCLSFPPS